MVLNLPHCIDCLGAAPWKEGALVVPFILGFSFKRFIKRTVRTVKKTIKNPVTQVLRGSVRVLSVGLVNLKENDAKKIVATATPIVFPITALLPAKALGFKGDISKQRFRKSRKAVQITTGAAAVAVGAVVAAPFAAGALGSFATAGVAATATSAAVPAVAGSGVLGFLGAIGASVSTIAGPLFGAAKKFMTPSGNGMGTQRAAALEEQRLRGIDAGTDKAGLFGGSFNITNKESIPILIGGLILVIVLSAFAVKRS